MIQRFQSAIARRETELTKAARARLAAIEAGEGRFSDDEPFLVAGTGGGRRNNKLFAQDTPLLSHTRKAWPLLHADGSITTEIVHTARVPDNMTTTTDSLRRGAFNGTVRDSTQSLSRTEVWTRARLSDRRCRRGRRSTGGRA